MLKSANFSKIFEFELKIECLFYLIVNEEFCGELRACGRDILVLAPEWLRQEFQSDSKLLIQRYNEIESKNNN